MNIQVFGTKKCNNTQKAIRFLKERQLNFQFVDLNEKKISKGELSSILKYIPIENLIDKESKIYKNKNLQYMQFDKEEILLENPLIIKTPIIRTNNNAFIGFDIDKLKKIIN